MTVGRVRGRRATREVVLGGGRARLILGDCREIVPTLDVRVDVVITSPPYNLGTTTGGGMPGKKLGRYAHGSRGLARGGMRKWSGELLVHGYGLHDDAMLHHDYVVWQKECVSLCWERLSSHGAIFYNHKPRVLNGVLVSPITYISPELPIRQIVIWARAGGINFSPVFYCPTHEWVVIIAKPGFRLRDKSASGVGDVWYIPQEKNSNHHPAPFPLALPRTIIETTASEIILDPFMGIGTTGVAAVQLGRKFIGIELEPKYFDVAVDRVGETLARGDLLSDSTPSDLGPGRQRDLL